MLYLPHRVVFIIADYYPVEIYTLNVECVIDLRTHKSLGVDARNNCDYYARSHLRYPHVILACKLSLIIFIGLCGPVELMSTN